MRNVFRDGSCDTAAFVGRRVFPYPLCTCVDRCCDGDMSYCGYRPNVRQRADARGGLNQTAFSLYLFIRDVADGDLAGWLDRRLQAAAKPAGLGRLARMRMAVLAPLKEVYGVSDKVLMVALSSLLLGAPRRGAWPEVGAGMIAVDTLVHNFLHRTGILHRLDASHAYGPTGPAAAPRSSRRSQRIDARKFNRNKLSTLCAACDLEIVRAGGPRHLQRQSHR